MGQAPKELRDWVLRRDGHRCQHHWKKDGKWVRCPNTKDLHVHHILAEGYIKAHLPHIDPHEPTNLITICAKHHVGRGMP